MNKSFFVLYEDGKGEIIKAPNSSKVVEWIATFYGMMALDRVVDIYEVQ